MNLDIRWWSKFDQDCKNSGTIKHCLNKQSDQNSEINSKKQSTFQTNEENRVGVSERKWKYIGVQSFVWLPETCHTK